MKKQATYRHFWGIALAMLFAGTFVLRSAHHLFFHDHAHHPVCEKTFARDGGTHIHNEEYKPDDCSACAFLFAIPEIVSITALVRQPVAVSDSLPCPVAQFFIGKDCEGTHLRGPPARF
ncbi:MAG: hypothetical protein ACK4Q5_11625 [Saprospiraceae bacterium]